MPVRIRLARWGQRHSPFYRIIAADARAPRDGKFLEILGAYAPLPHSRREASKHIKRVWLNIPRIKHWLGAGAVPSDTVARLLGSAGLTPISPRTIAAASSSQAAVVAAAQRRGLITSSTLASSGFSHQSSCRGIAVVLGSQNVNAGNGVFTRRLV